MSGNLPTKQHCRISGSSIRGRDNVWEPPNKTTLCRISGRIDGKVCPLFFFNLFFKCRAIHRVVMQSPASHHANPVGPVSDRSVVGNITVEFVRASLKVLQVFRLY